MLKNTGQTGETEPISLLLQGTHRASCRGLRWHQGWSRGTPSPLGVSRQGYPPVPVPLTSDMEALNFCYSLLTLECLPLHLTDQRSASLPFLLLRKPFQTSCLLTFSWLWDPRLSSLLPILHWKLNSHAICQEPSAAQDKP